MDEIRHAALVKGLIPHAPEVSIESCVWTDEEILARQPRVEGLLIRRGPLLFPEMTPEQVAILTSIIGDEKGHVKWVLAVRNRVGVRSVRALHTSPAAWMALRAIKSMGG